MAARSVLTPGLPMLQHHKHSFGATHGCFHLSVGS